MCLPGYYNMVMVILKFIVCAGFIFVAGRFVARYADVIAEKSGLGEVWVGVILVAFTTSLPELFTGISSAALVGAPNIAIGNIMGANSYNLLNLGLIEILSKGASPLLSSMSQGQILTAALSLIPLIILTLAMILSESGGALASFWGVGTLSFAIFGAYCISAAIVYNFEKKKRNISQEKLAKALGRYEDVLIGKAYLYFCLAALVIVICGIWLAYIGKELSVLMGLSQSFVGTLFIGLATTLPEITVSIAALAIGAKEIAVANMLGSNLFNTTIIFIDDIFYRKGPILADISSGHLAQAFTVMAMTAIVIIAMAQKPKRKFLRMGWYVPVLIALFIVGAYVNFMMGAK